MRVSLHDNMLIINNLTTNYSGRYHCIAHSQAGVVLSDNVDVTVVDLVKEGDTISVTSSVGSLVHLQCINSTLLSPVMWYFNNMELPLSNNFVLLTNGNLVIFNVTYNNSGLYTCQVGGVFNISRTLTVEGKLE